MMPDPRRVLAGLRKARGLILLLPVLGAAAVAREAPAPGGANAARGESELILAAEESLRAGSCRGASENYLGAARASADAGVAARATQLALGCEQLATAQAAAARWRELAPYSGEASLAAALVALKRYDLADARQALAAWRDSGAAGSQDPLRFAELLEQETSATAVYQVFSQVLVGEDPTAEVRLAQARLALGAQDMAAAIKAAQQARALDSGLVEAASIELRARSVLGEHDAAIAGARALGDALEGDNAFLVADLLIAADRQGEAREELERLSAQPETKLGAEHRLVGLAFEAGDYEAAGQRLEALVSARNATAVTYYYLAQLAERRGDILRAAQTYQLLVDTPIALRARTAIARLMLRRGSRDGAMRLLDEYVAQKPESAVEVGVTRAQLLAQNGDIEVALAGLDDLLQRYPDHPDLIYQRATVLAAGKRSREAIAELEKLYRQRPDDPQVSNALGFTMADSNQRLSRAEQLVQRALKVSPDSPAIQDSMGWVLFRRGHVKESLPVLERAWFNSKDAEIAAHFGEALWKGGDEGRARYVWQQALNAAPDDKALRATMTRLTGEAPPALP
ncbi:MAG: tetratricopeptide repeat protein [Steroidobacteraceae bacterium]